MKFNCNLVAKLAHEMPDGRRTYNVTCRGGQPHVVALLFKSNPRTRAENRHHYTHQTSLWWARLEIGPRDLGAFETAEEAGLAISAALREV
ncbi:MAG: hypothetical protein A3E78_12250 [Alphaproteobacteria bacterium RIFCSPHIGHO2_12_FULL_63_12]|nr:MAG: hypothetical protein A3E78_12250 [Alphaproteobacteria bacterium RIFCSPHIGHO2_12_FULL_63_12]